MKPLKINLALQGGGAHGAFTWGVLIRLLEEEWLEFDGISGTSAGAMNAVMLAEGWRKDGRRGAAAQLDAFWEAIADKGIQMPMPKILEQSLNKWWMSMFQHFSPYDINTMDINPLRDVLDEITDFKTLQHHSPFRLFIAATEVTTGKLELFNEQELTVSHVLASACLPNVYKAVTINNKHYWDGGYAANPAIFPLIHSCDAQDVLIVLLQPLQRGALPVRSEEISDRISELTFHCAFLREMRSMLDIKTSSQRWGWVSGDFEKRIRATRTHIIENSELMSALDQMSKYDNSRAFLLELKEEGIKTAEQWLETSTGDLGKRDSCDLPGLFG
ncbi:patatin-like phospholipase family protein [Alteromonas sp. 1_MG-2023]|uniref:patatin-like phospholipase family protein n=1 Tax=Alteromonas sp. 1_MG-2023 TaxID=3062669 RepID=UPI0026E22C99|nr:patatin-like phospholipase family protein [Alteromonas sp. 1_MG-2023]MDO6476701.1 patatin-like phospholipase family protein [Alteromonas sp. 1_MG-2023]